MTFEIGKIERIEFGHGGYQNACIGVSVVLSGKGWGVQDFKGTWHIPRSATAQWTEEDRIRSLGETVMWLNGILNDANRQTVSELKGVPVKAEFDGGRLVSWRILTEVL